MDLGKRLVRPAIRARQVVVLPGSDVQMFRWIMIWMVVC